MSLKTFHMFFILCAMLLVGWLGIIEIQVYGQSRSLRGLASGFVFFAGAAGLAVYLLWFLKKIKKADPS